MSLYEMFKSAIGWTEVTPSEPPIASLTIISTEPVKRSSGSR